MIASPSTTGDFVGVGLILFGTIICAITYFTNKYRIYKGIEEYKDIRKIYTVNDRKKPKPKPKPSEESSGFSIIGVIPAIIVLAVGGYVSITVMGEIQKVVMSDASINTTQTSVSMSEITSLFPTVFAIGSLLVVIFGIFGCIGTMRVD